MLTSWTASQVTVVTLDGMATSTNPAHEPPRVDPLVLGRRLRHLRRTSGATLSDVAGKVGVTASHLSLVENGHREPRLTLLTALAGAFGVEVEDLLTPEAPSRRAALEVAVERAQRGSLFQRLGLPALKIGPRTPDEVLEVIAGLQAELDRQMAERVSTPEEARRANSALREEMRACGNHYADLERRAQELREAVDVADGPLTHHHVSALAEHLGFAVRFVPDLPHSTRSVTDLKNRRIYLSRSRRPDHDPRAVLLQAVCSSVLGHGEPADYAEFLRQRVYTNYLAAAMMMPERGTVRALREAKERRDLSVDDLRDRFGVSWESAAHRFTNLATEHLGLTCHFAKVHESGVFHKAYENDGIPFPRDHIGAIEGQTACRYWTSRQVFSVADHLGAFPQYTDTPAGTFWSAAVVEPTSTGFYSLTVGVPFDDAKWFRGRETSARTRSTCPDPQCCRLPSADLEAAWGGQAWPAARANAHLLAAMPSGAFPGVEEVQVFEFLQTQESRWPPEGSGAA